MISRNQGMKLIVNALLSSLPAMSNVVIVCFLFLLIFAIVGVSFFKGAFGRCHLDDEELLATVVSRQNCTDFGGEWQVPIENFDSAPKGMLTLLEMMTTEGWIDVMYNGLDAVPVKDGMEMQPKTNNKKILVIYFILYMVFGSQFILNLFVGVIMDNFNKIKD
jgi:voltage-gated cation channel